MTRESYWVPAVVACTQLTLMIGFISTLTFLGITGDNNQDIEQCDEYLDFGEEINNLVKACTEITQKETGDFRNQVAGHVKQPILTYKNSVLKPLNKRIHFFRELRFYYMIQKFGSHWTQSAKSFVPALTGWFSKCHTHALPNTTKSNSELSIPNEDKKKPVNDYVDEFLRNKQIYLGLVDLTKSHHKPCAIDIKMGKQTYEPGADMDKKKREIRKCPYQTEVGFRITGFQVYDARCDALGTVSKRFGRKLNPPIVYEALAAFFYDGVRIRRDIVLAAIQELEKLLLWFKSQTQMHFYCSSLLITYDAWVGHEYSQLHYVPESQHFLQSLGPQFPPPHPELLNKESEISHAGVSIEEENENDDNEKDEIFSEAFLSERKKQRFRSKSLQDTRNVRKSPPPPNGGIQVKMIDFAHALPSQRGLDEGYIHGLRSLITRLHKVIEDDDVIKRLFRGSAIYDREAVGFRRDEEC
jgi:hypothetical protein